MSNNYAKRSRAEGEISTEEAADRIGAHPATLRRWAKEVMLGKPAPLSKIRRDFAGRFWFNEEEVGELLDHRA